MKTRRIVLASVVLLLAILLLAASASAGRGSEFSCTVPWDTFEWLRGPTWTYTGNTGHRDAAARIKANCAPQLRGWIYLDGQINGVRFVGDPADEVIYGHEHGKAWVQSEDGQLLWTGSYHWDIAPQGYGGEFVAQGVGPNEGLQLRYYLTCGEANGWENAVTGRIC